MGGAVSGLAFMPPPRTEAELSKFQREPSLIVVPASSSPTSGQVDENTAPVSALYLDRGAAVTVLYSHANAEDLLDVRETLSRLSEELNVNVLGYDYHGYGLSEGPCSEASCCRAAGACLEYLVGRGVDRGSIVLMGRSLGTGPTVDLAAREPGIAGVVLQSPLLSVLRTRLSERMARAMRNVDLFDNAKKISNVVCPVFVIHGSEDFIVPLSHGEEICRLARNAVRPFWADGCGHNDLHRHADYYGRLTEFVEFVRIRRRRQWEGTIAAFAPQMVVLSRPQPKLVLTAL